MSNPPQIRRIVSSFLTTGKPHHPSFRVALFRRAATRPVYPNTWAAVSGNIEPTDPSPLAAAWREIREETGLGEPQLRLSKQGRQIVLQDPGLRTTWQIFPFVFALAALEEGRRPEEVVRLDAEHDEVRFVSLEEMRGMRTVDNLYESLMGALGREGE